MTSGSTHGPDSAQTDTTFGAFTQALFDEAKANDWIIVSMKRDWKHLFICEA
jgi:hypothetical protein